MNHLVEAAAEVATRLHAEASELDRTGIMPRATIGLLDAAGLLGAPLAVAHGGLGLGASGSTAILLEVLTAVGAGNLAVGRLYEGHVNALLLVDRYGTSRQRQRAANLVLRDRALLGVWNTDAAVPLNMEPDGAEWRLAGGKSFASGAGLVGHALVTAGLGGETRQMLLVPMAGLEERIDERRWRPLGMRASMSFDVDLDGVTVGPDTLIGGPDEYLQQPWFSAGCIRFAAVQLGGALAVLRTIHAHLRRTGRHGDPYQVERFAGMRVALESGRRLLAEAARRLDDIGPEDDPEPPIIAAQMARHAVEQACECVLGLGTRSVGMAGMLMPHPMERLVRDLSTYLRQPGPDAAFASIGQHALDAVEMPW